MEGWKVWVRIDGEGLCENLVEGRALMVSHLVQFSVGRRKRKVFLVSSETK